MRVFALLSYWDERPDHLDRCVRSLAGFCDHVVAIDGPYATFEPVRDYSALEQQTAIYRACAENGIRTSWRHGTFDSEVAKRAQLFSDGRDAGATPDDWFLIIDADMALADFSPDACAWLQFTKMDVADVRWHDVQIDGKPTSTLTFRSLFRALPGLTVERTHYLYTVPEPCSFCGCGIAEHAMGDAYDEQQRPCKVGRRFLWHAPSGQISREPALDLTDALTLHHFNSQRDDDRKQRALRYYQARDAAHLESAGDWK